MEKVGNIRKSPVLKGFHFLRKCFWMETDSN